jgi:lipoprotein-anchoring transpeptidase ErfK/SrfK
MSPPDKLTLIDGGSGSRRWVKRTVALTAVALPFAALVVLAVLVTTSKASIAANRTSLATIKLPFGGATVTRVAAVVGREQKDLPVKLIGDQVWPTQSVPSGQPVTVIAVVERPGWNRWLAGARAEVRLTITTPRAKLASSYVTVAKGADIRLHFNRPVARFASGPVGARLTAKTLARPQSTLSLRPTAVAGTLSLLAAARPWETPVKQAVSWFPAGSAATAVATPAPGTKITANSTITLTFSKTVRKALSGTLPAVTPAGSGAWRTVNSHTITFVPSGYGYGLGAKVQVAVPAGVHLIGGTGDPVGTWTVPTGSTTRLQQLLAGLGYLPVDFTQTGTPVAETLAAEEAAAVKAPTGSFTWRYSDTPAALKAQWVPGEYTEVTKAAVMAFESANDITADGIDGPAVWKALIAATLRHATNSFGYTFVFVHEASSDETESTWHDGKVVVSGPVNTGTAAAGGTQPGVFAVFEHLLSTTMSGTNPDGSTYHDPGIPHVSYFNGGDALHGYIRASYGFPQSDGCVEMPYAEAAAVYPYTPVGTVVDVSTS